MPDQRDAELPDLEDAAYIEVFVAITGEQRSFNPQELRRQIEVGRKWWRHNFSSLREAVCGDPRILAARESLEAPEAELMVVLVDVLATAWGEVPAATVSRILIELGLDRLCP